MTVEDNAHQVPLDTDFDVGFADAIARLETYNKHHYRPNSYLHKWWARRCGSTFRLILKQLVEDEWQRGYYAAGGLEGKVILDPMMGGGTTLHEAIRLGANVMGVDLDPIPVLQARATLSELPLLDLEQAYRTLYRSLRRELDPYFRTTCPHCGRVTPVRYVLYGLRRFCRCGPVLIVDSAVLRQETDGSTIRLCRHCHAVVDGRAVGNGHAQEACLCPPVEEAIPIIEKGTKSCLTCGETYAEDLETPYYTRYEPLVVVGRCQQHSLFFKSPDAADLESLQQANEQRETLTLDGRAFRIKPGRKSIHLIRRGIRNYLDLFSSRQLRYLQQAMAHLPQFDPLIRLNLALLVSTSLEFNSMLCGYKGKNKRRAGAIRHTFSHHAYSFPYTALENNPLYPRKASGTLQKLFHGRLRRGRLWAQAPRERDLGHEKATFVEIEGERDGGREVTDTAELDGGCRRFRLQQGSATRLDLAADSVDYVVTDPPYFDSVQYSDLSAFFRIWLRQFLPGAARWEYDETESAVDPHNNDEESRYSEIIGDIFGECHRVLNKEHGRFIFTFHHWNPKGWAALTVALKQAGFVLVNRYVVHAENPMSVHIASMKALTHDAILVLAPIEAGVRPAWERPSRVNRDDSYAFCRDCATLLGWMLNANLSPTDIDGTWKRALEERHD